MARSRSSERIAAMASRLLAVALLLAVAGVVVMLSVPLATNLFEANQRITDQRDQLGRFLAIAEQKEQLLSGRKPIDAAKTPPEFYPPATDATATADLQSRLRTLTGDAGVTLLSSEAIAAAAENDPRIRIRIELAGEIAAIQKLVRQIEAQTPFLFIEAAELRPDLTGPAPEPGVRPRLMMGARLVVRATRWQVNLSQ